MSWEKEFEKYKIFEKLYFDVLLDFCKERNVLPKKEDYRYTWEMKASLPPIDSLKIIEIKHQCNGVRNIYLGNYEVDFFEKMYLKADEHIKEMMCVGGFGSFSLDRGLAFTKSKNENHVLEVWKFLKKENLFSPSNKFGSERLIKDLQKNCSTELYDKLIDLYLTEHKNKLNKKSNKIMLNLMLSKTSDEIYNKFNVHSDNEDNVNLFEELNIDCFDLNISKNKLFDLILLSNKNKYNDMHESFLKHLSNDELLNKLGIIQIDGEEKYKSSKYLRYVFRVKKDEFSKENAKDLIISFFKLYSSTLNNRSENETEHDVLKTINSEKINALYLTQSLNKKLEEKKEIKPKKNKI